MKGRPLQPRQKTTKKTLEKISYPNSNGINKEAIQLFTTFKMPKLLILFHQFGGDGCSKHPPLPIHSSFPPFLQEPLSIVVHPCYGYERIKGSDLGQNISLFSSLYKLS